jgi:hypothetical protein
MTSIIIDTKDGHEKDVLDSVELSFASNNETYIGRLTGTGNPIGIDGRYESRVYLTDPDRFEYPLWRGVATVGPYHNEDYGKIWLPNSGFSTTTSYILAHERGHNLGFRHTGGFMDYEKPDVGLDTPLAEETKTTVKHTDGIDIIDWSTGSKAVFDVISLWRDNDVPASDVFYAIDKWRDGFSGETVVCKGDFSEDIDLSQTNISLNEGGLYRPERADNYDVWG